MKLISSLILSFGLFSAAGVAQAESVYNTVFETRAIAEQNCDFPDIVQPYYNWNFELEGYVCLKINDGRD